MVRKFLILALLFLGMSFADEASSSDLEKLTLGEGWLNAIPKEQFKNRVIAIEFWGIN